MDIRKLIREQMESLFGQNSGYENGIVGSEIVGHLNDLPQTREEVDFNANPRITYSIPDIINGNATVLVFEKEFFTGWDRPYMRQGKEIPHKGLGYVAEFKKKFGEEPIYKINGREIDILNPNFNEWRKGNISQVEKAISQFGSTD